MSCHSLAGPQIHHLGIPHLVNCMVWGACGLLDYKLCRRLNYQQGICPSNKFTNKFYVPRSICIYGFTKELNVSNMPDEKISMSPTCASDVINNVNNNTCSLLCPKRPNSTLVSCIELFAKRLITTAAIGTIIGHGRLLLFSLLIINNFSFLASLFLFSRYCHFWEKIWVFFLLDLYMTNLSFYKKQIPT